MSDEHRPVVEAGGTGDRRSPFDRFVEAAHLHVSRGWFFFICAGIILVWLVSVPLWVDLKTWQATIHTVASVLTLLLLTLLENAARRSAEAAQEKLNVVAEALAALLDSRVPEDPQVAEAAERLRDAIGLEQRH